MRPEPTVLYVEDEENDAYLVQFAFESSGIAASLHVVPDGRQAMEYLSPRLDSAASRSRQAPRLILLDLNLPVINGFEVLKWVRSQVALADVPVVVFSSSDNPKDRQRARELGANDYMVKPVDMSRLNQTVQALERKWLGKARIGNIP